MAQWIILFSAVSFYLGVISGFGICRWGFEKMIEEEEEEEKKKKKTLDN